VASATSAAAGARICARARGIRATTPTAATRRRRSCPEAYAYAIPASFGDEHAAPLLCAGIIGYRALALSEVAPGGRLALYGFGSSAHVVLQIARHRGCEVYVATRGKSHQELALRMGAAWAGSATETPPVPADGAIIFAPAGELVPVALRAVRNGGTVACAGIYMSDIPAMTYGEHLFHEKKLRSVEANTRRDGEGLLAEAAEIPIRPVVTALRARRSERGADRARRRPHRRHRRARLRLVNAPAKARNACVALPTFYEIGMATPAIGKKAPDFTLAATGDQTVKLSDLKGKKVVLYFYPEGQHARLHARRLRLPRQPEPGQACRRGRLRRFARLDRVAREVQGEPRLQLRPSLGRRGKACDAYGVIKDKNMYGKKVRGIERSTFLGRRQGRAEKRVARRQGRRPRGRGARRAEGDLALQTRPRSSAAAALLVLFSADVWAQSPAETADPTAPSRRAMVEQIKKTAAYGPQPISERVLDVMAQVPRHELVPGEARAAAYLDTPLPIGDGQTISQPYIVALMTELADVQPNEKVLEVGTGSGYQAAVLSGLAANVYTIEIVERLGRTAAAALARLGYRNVEVKIGDGYKGWREHAPFDAIVVTAAPKEIPPALIDQLAPGGKLVAPVGGSSFEQQLTVLEKGRDGKISKREVLPVRFVPLVRGH
jgi:protein-L-isoaspartate(D-aspartate) O-methyltransferase